MENRLNIIKVLKNDYAAFLGLLLGILFLLVIILASLPFENKYHLIRWSLLKKNGFPECIFTFDFITLVSFVFLSLCGFTLLLLRLIYLKSFENSFIRVKGEIVYSVNYSKSIVSVSLKYSYKDKDYKKWIAINRNKYTEKMFVGELIVLVKEDNPKKAVLYDLYYD